MLVNKEICLILMKCNCKCLLLCYCLNKITREEITICSQKIALCTSKMDSSSSSLSSDWDIVNSISVIPEESIEESPNEITSNEWVDDKECPPMGSGVDDINDADISNQNDSNSSSDIDVIEETPDDLIRMSISPMEYSMSSSLSVGSLVPSPAPVPNVEEGRNSFLFIQRLLRNPQIKDYLIIIFISIVIASSVHFQGTPEDKIKEMKEQVDELKKENTDLRNHVISSKIEDDKLFLTLDEQIGALKMENHKLSNSLQSLIIHLEEQTAVFKKENEMREKDPYKNEIDKLKEQMNLLQIDNDELQKQLVRMRYGAYTPNSENAKEESSGEEEVKSDNNEDIENVSDILTEEIEKLKKKLYSEVDELKDWKEAIDNLIKRLNDKEKKGTENKEGFENKKTTDEKFRKPTKEDKNEKPNKEKAFYDWSWKDLKKNFKDTFDNINVSDMFSKYASMDEKKVKGVFDSVNHYFKKAQEKTKKILNFNENGKDEVWNFLGDLRKKWADMRDEFFENHHRNGPVPPDDYKNDHKKDQASDFTDKLHDFEEDKKKSNSHFNTKDQHPTKPKMDLNNPKKEQILTFERVINDPKLKHRMENRFGPGWQAEMKKFIEEQDLNDISNEDERVMGDKLPNEQAKKPEESWILKRAAMRSIIREHDDQEDSTNWYLRRKKPAKGDFDTGFYDAFEEKE